MQNDGNEARNEKLHVVDDSESALPSTQATQEAEQQDNTKHQHVVSASPTRAPSHDRTASPVAQGVSEDDEEARSPPSLGWNIDSPHKSSPPSLPIALHLDDNLTDSAKKKKVEDAIVKTEKEDRRDTTLPLPWQIQSTGMCCMFCLSSMYCVHCMNCINYM